jgi:hypothetical protein
VRKHTEPRPGAPARPRTPRRWAALRRPVRHRWAEYCRNSHDSGRDAGTATAFVVGFAVVLLAFAGLVVDGGLAINARQRVADHAEQAARAGSQAVDLTTVRRDGTAASLDPAQARAAVANFLSVHGYNGDSVRIDAEPDGVTVTIVKDEPTQLLSLVGFRSFHIEATAQARPAVGIETEF